MSALIDLYNAFITRKVVSVLGVMWLSVTSLSVIANDNSYYKVPLISSTLHSSLSYSDFNFPVIQSTSLALPLTERFGVEYSVTKHQNYSDLMALSITSQQDDSDKSANRYSFAQPMVFRITIKGYSLFQTEDGENHFFSFDRTRERELRKPNLLLSITKHF